ncbi:hypothetical protein MBLNU13_g09049t2 [Cladosporium sp. NU13]
MAPNLAVAQREQIHAMLQAGRFTGDQIAKVAGCSSQTVSAIRSNIRAFGNSREPFTAAPGRPRSITPTMFDALNELLLGKPDRQLDELAAFFREEFDVDVSTSTISRTLIAEGWSKKMVRRKAKEQSADLRDKYLHELSAFASCHLVYIDESGCDRRVGFRRTGWSPVGITPVQTERFHWGQRYHILPAYTQDGVLLARIYQGSTDGEVFEDFLGELLQWYEKLKLQHWAEVAYETEDQAPHPILKHWLHPIRCASVHAVTDTEEVVDVDATKHDVLNIPWDVFKSRAGKGEIFNTPLLIKETFADADEFTVERYADGLEQTFLGMDVIVRNHMSAPESLPVSEAACLVRTPHDTVLPKAPNFLDLESLSNAIKPGLTRLPRYRLLDTLVRGAKANYAGRTGKKTYLTPFDVGSCQSFEILGLRGAFSGAHMDASGGTWLRNLFGTKLWMIVPERLMTDQDWVEFSKAGSSWNPGTKSRALILGPGDVFFMPPGTRVIHAVLTLETCLMDGGMLWDDLTLLPLLHTIHWIGRNQNATNEALPFQLGEVLNQLERALDQVVGTSRFGHTAGLLQAIRDLRSLGYHVMETGRECFEEPRSEESDYAGSSYEGDD